MPILVKEIAIDELDERLIRDNLENPERISVEAYRQLMLKLRAQTVQRAIAAAKAEGKEDIPLTDNPELIQWFVSRPEYQSAAIRARQERRERLASDLASVRQELTAHTARLKNSPDASSQLKESMQRTIESLKSQMTALEAERAEIEQ